jgi:AhpD family alkylhydroperoxidase
MRLAPVEKPKGLKTRLAYWSSKRRLGKAITPLKVVYARVPKSMNVAYAFVQLQEKGLTLDPALRHLIQTYVARLNGCDFCADIGEAMALRRRLPIEKLRAIEEFLTNPAFTERERAALAYAGEATRRKKVSDETFQRLRQHFNDREIVEITLLNAVENFYNLINLPLEIESDGLCALVPRRAAGAATNLPTGAAARGE